MKKLVSTIFILIIALCLNSPAFAQNNEKPTKAETDLLEKLLPLVQKGLVIPAKIEPQDEDGLVLVEPLLWKNLTHVQKYALLQSIMAFYSIHNKLKGTHIKGAMASDITSKESLGLVNLETKKVTVKK